MQVSFVLVSFLAVFGAAFARPKETDLATFAVEERVLASIIDFITGITDAFDPIHISHFDRTLFGYHLVLDNALFKGFSDVIALDEWKTEGLGVSYQISIDIPKLYSTIENWQVEGEKFFGKGTANLDVESVKITVKGGWKLLGGAHLYISGSVGKAQAAITGLYNDEQLSQQVTDDLNNFMNVVLNDQDVYNRLSEKILAVVNEILGSIGVAEEY